MKCPSLSEMSTSVGRAVGSPKNYSVTFKLPTIRSEVELAPLENQPSLAPAAGRVQKLFEGSSLKGFAAAVSTVLAAVIVLGGIGALIGCTGGLAAIAVAITLFVLGTVTNVSYKHPAPPIPEVIAEAPPAPRTYMGYFASFIPGYQA